MLRAMLIVVLISGGAFSSRADAEPTDLPGFTDFEFDGLPFGALLEEFPVEGDGITATFTSTGAGDRVGAGFFGIGEAYHSGRYSWMVLEGTGRIEFSEPVSLVEFYAADLDAQGTIQAFSPEGAALLSDPLTIPDGGFQGDPREFIRLDMAELNEAIGAIELSSTARIGDEMSVIDDFGFVRFVPVFSYQNQVNRYDVDDNGFVNALDLLKVIRDINALGNRELPAPSSIPELFVDVNGDSVVNPLDVLTVIRRLNEIAAGDSAVVPEPTTAAMAWIALAGGAIVLRLRAGRFSSSMKR